MRRYTLRQIDTFLEVVRQQSVSRAAEILGVTQPAVSMQLRQLEDALGLPLLEQVGRKITLTDAGLDIQQYAAAAVAQMKQLDDAVAERRGVRKGRVELGIVSTAKYFVPMLLVRFRKKFPDIEVARHIHNRESVMGLLARNEADLVIMGRTPEGMDCVATPITRSELSVRPSILCRAAVGHRCPY